MQLLVDSIVAVNTIAIVGVITHLWSVSRGTKP